MPIEVEDDALVVEAVDLDSNAEALLLDASVIPFFFLIQECVESFF